MIVYNGVFKIKLIRETVGGILKCPALDSQEVSEVKKEDIVFVKTESGDQPILTDITGKFLPVESVKQLRKYFRGKLVLTYVVAGLFWAGLIFCALHSALEYFDKGMIWYRFLSLAAFAFLAILYTLQAHNPIVHDSAGNWIHLRTGSTNLHGGINIAKS